MLNIRSNITQRRKIEFFQYRDMNDFLINVISSKLKEFAELNADKKNFVSNQMCQILKL